MIFVWFMDYGCLELVELSINVSVLQEIVNLHLTSLSGLHELFEVILTDLEKRNPLKS